MENATSFLTINIIFFPLFGNAKWNKKYIIYV